MRPTTDDILTALELISARVPDRHITPDRPMALSWYDDLSRYNRDAVFRAAREWGGLRFPAASEFIAAVRECATAIADEEAARYAAGELALETCPEGCVDGWLLSTIDRPGGRYLMARPCERCRPIGYAMWRHEIATDDHDRDRCPDCRAIRKGKDPLPAWYVEARENAALGRTSVEVF